MKTSYQLTGLTCGNCVATVHSTLLAIDGVHAVEVSKEKNTAVITMEYAIPLTVFQEALSDKYKIFSPHEKETTTDTPTLWHTYKPLLVILFYLLGTVSLIEFTSDRIDIMRWMRHFMGGFFLVFSFFKILDLKGFKDSYVMYDVIAKKFPLWGYGYAFIELGLGISFIANLHPILVNGITFLVMSLSLIGVLQAVWNKKEIQCACLGAVFNLPMSAVTIIEDGLMILMSAGLLFLSC